ncbi:SRPBCC family protein [Leptothermofonsia sp. ETS-13]|uniref:SRPBCC family protein n=1 Tax=Leptothermofonsia sp. ETS-13 TaxID=3035696 RepID=UPI003B9DFDAC
MANYQFLTIWELDAPIETVWDALTHSERWPGWWKSVKQVVELEAGSSDGLGNVRRFTWKMPLSYTLTFETCVTRIEPPNLMEARAIGEVEGVGLWELSTTSQGTEVRYTWNVKTTKAWMNVLALFIKPLMEWNHNAVMQEGGKGLAQLLGVRLLKMDV